jgi:branched-chain amino acid transport system substrate-binding protein
MIFTASRVRMEQTAQYAGQLRCPLQREESMTMKRAFSTGLSAAGFILISGLTVAGGQNAPGVTDTEIKVGQTMPYSGPASAWGAIGRAELAYVKMINERGGIKGRKINMISLDDGFSPPKTVEQTRRLVEAEGVAFIYGTAGTGNLAIRDYLNERHVPQLFILAPLEKYNDPQHYPWTMGLQPTFYREGFTHARYILAHKADAKIAILHANDDSDEGVKGLKDGLGDRADKLIVKELSYEWSDPTIDSQIVTLKGSGADTFYNMAYPKSAAQAIRKASEIGWKPLHLLTYISQSISAVLEPAGFENSIGIISGFYAKDPTDPRWADDVSTTEFLAWLQRYYPGGKPSDVFVFAGYAFAQPLIYLLEQCGDDLSRENIMRQAASFHDVRLPWLLPGITSSTSPTDYQPIKKLRETRFNGKTWELLDEPN